MEKEIDAPNTRMILSVWVLIRKAKTTIINYGRASELEDALKRIKALSNPSKDPLYGKEGFLKSHWK